MPAASLHRAESSAPTGLSASAFVAKWARNGKSHGLGERAGAQAHFFELCDLLGVERPDDPENYCFERGMKGLTGKIRFADVWKRGCFAWEYKRPGGNLGEALEQLMRYTLPLDNPPLLVVSDRERVEIHTHFTGYPSRRIVIQNSDLTDRRVIARLRDIFFDPYAFRPEHDSKHVTESAARAFATIADSLRHEGVPAQQSAHFLTQCVFCYFAEDIGLLGSFKRVVLKRSTPVALKESLSELFLKMQRGGTFGADDIAWFNGGLFNQIDVPLMSPTGINTLAEVADMDWSAVDPSIFGTLFERGLDPAKRAQLGAFYTNPTLILRLVTPIVARTLIAEWEACKSKINGLLSQRDVLRVRAKGIPSTSSKLDDRRSRIQTKANRAAREAKDVFDAYLERLRNFRVLDPACGSGNFLYLSLKALKDIEKQANIDAEALGLQAQLPVTGPQNVLGIEVNEYAAELARMTVWIGELQWRKQNGYGWKLNPILDSLDHIECRDALLRRDGNAYIEATWPTADVIVGNPPFVGNKRMREELGDDYTSALRGSFGSTLSGGVDLVCYWFDKAHRAISKGKAYAAGLVSTQSVRHGSNRIVLDAICEDGAIFEAWSDEPWVNDGAAVRVSLVCFGRTFEGMPRLDGNAVPRITPDLGGSGEIDLTKAVPLPANSGVAFQGPVKVGPFDIPGDLARAWLALPNVNGRSNAEVLRPWVNGQDIARRNSDTWIVDFGATMTEAEASKFEEPFRHVLQNVKPMRELGNRESRKKFWWLHGETVPGLRARLRGLRRYIATPRVARHRYFVWVPAQVWPDSRLYVIASEDDFTFGVLSSRLHKVWALANASMHGIGNDPTYNAKSCFETFPFPLFDTKSNRAALREQVEACAIELDQLRNTWLNPPEWVQHVPERAPLNMADSPYPARVIAREGFETRLASRTLTKLYSENPPWLTNAQHALDTAVAKAYGWRDYSADLSDTEVLLRIASLNTARVVTATS